MTTSQGHQRQHWSKRWCPFQVRQGPSTHLTFYVSHLTSQGAPNGPTRTLKPDQNRRPLAALPPEIGQLTRLQSLILSDTHLSAIPPEIGQLTQLQSLKLTYNQLTALPPAISQLTNLYTLELCGNLIPIPPKIIAKTRNPQIIIHTFLDFLAEQSHPLQGKTALAG
ncbi:MAG: hypothetical protein GY832_13730 [Chloroflexi bacterium]|nr:hypothetical protein [Chloroflexota bacterium]